jgi:hypothetical protein
MKRIFKNKILASFSLLSLSIAAMLMPLTSSPAETKLTLLDNIVLVKKHVYNDPELTAQKTHSFQKQCTKMKEALYETTKQASAAPKEGDYLSLDKIRQLHDVTVTEYFRGTDYARYEVGQTWDVSFQTNEQNKLKEEEIYCRIAPKQFTKGEIRTASEKITFHKTGNDPGVVEVSQMRPELMAIIKPPYLAKDLVAQKIKNGKAECLSKPELLDCYFKDIPIHTGTKKLVVAESKLPAKGLNKGMDAILEMQIPNMLAGFGDGTIFKAGDYAKIYENISVTVGKEISNKQFELPDFAKDYKIIRK